MRSSTIFSLENISFHSGRRVVRPVAFFTLSQREGREGKAGSLKGSKATESTSSPADPSKLNSLLVEEYLLGMEYESPTLLRDVE